MTRQGDHRQPTARRRSGNNLTQRVQRIQVGPIGRDSLEGGE